MAANMAMASISAANAQAERVAALAHAKGRDYCRIVRAVFHAVTGVFASRAWLTFLISLFPFCFAAGLLAWTEQNKDPLLGMGATHTAWRRAVTIVTILAVMLCWHAIFLRHQTVLVLMGKLLTWCSVALFVIASFDNEAATSYCALAPQRCEATSANYNPSRVGNLVVAPVLDYICCLIWILAAGVIHHRGNIIQKGIDAAAAEAKHAEEQMQYEAAHPAGGPAGGDKVFTVRVPASAAGTGAPPAGSY